jgi:CHAD domain-containing protein
MINLALRAQIEAMCERRKRALNWKDPEGVHSMRVMSRRLRSAIADFAPYLRKPALPVTRLRNLADRLGDVRDDDVAIAALEKLRSDTHGDVAAGIELLLAERTERREAERTDLRKALRPPSIREFRDDFEERLTQVFIAEQARADRNPFQEPLRFNEVIREVIGTRVKEMRAASPTIFFPFEIKKLHELRILAKRLRYSVELFETCLDPDLKPVAKEVALLQTSLGELHDCDVWIEDVGTRLRKIARKGRNDPEALKLKAACTWLLKHFTRERTEHYRDALARWQNWEADGLLNHLVQRSADTTAQ